MNTITFKQEITENTYYDINTVGQILSPIRKHRVILTIVLMLLPFLIAVSFQKQDFTLIIPVVIVSIMYTLMSVGSGKRKVSQFLEFAKELAGEVIINEKVVRIVNDTGFANEFPNSECEQIFKIEDRYLLKWKNQIVTIPEQYWDENFLKLFGVDEFYKDHYTALNLRTDITLGVMVIIVNTILFFAVLSPSVV